MGRPIRTMAAAAALALLATACSDDADKQADDSPLPVGTGQNKTTSAPATPSTPSAPSSSSSTESTPSTSAPGAGSTTSGPSVDTDATTSSGVNSNGLPPGLTTPEAKRAEKFVRDYISALNTAGRDPGTASRLQRFTAPGCRVCSNFRSSFDEMAKKKRRLAGDQVQVLKTVTDPTDDNTVLKVYLQVRQSPVDVVDDGGKKVGSVDVSKVRINSYDVQASNNSLKILQIRRVAGGIE